MRKLGIVAVALASLMLMAFAASAATAPVGEDMKGQLGIGVFGGLGVPTGKLAAKFDANGADMKLGYNFGVFVDYMLTKEIAVGADFRYAANNMKDQTGADGTTLKDLIKAKTMQYGVHGKYLLPTGGPTVPYLGLGVSMYSRKLELSSQFQTLMNITDVTSISDTKPGIDGMIGVGYKVNEMFSVGVNGAYHYTIGKLEHDFGTGTQEILKDWNFMTFNAAITYHIPMAKK